MLSRDRVEARFGAMGRDARVVVIGGPPRLDERARHLVEVLERKWSRFRSGSEVSRINATSGRAVVVSPETYGLVARAVGAWRATGGRFDPSLPAGAVRAAGDVPSPGCARVELDPRLRSVKVPAGVRLDVSGIAKGFAADLVVSDLVQGGAGGALVSIGADVRVAGEPPRPEGWFVDVDDPLRPGSLGRLRLREGAVSTCAAEVAAPGAGEPVGLDRLRDPRSGAPVATGIAAVTVVAGEAWWGQALARAAFVAGPDAGVALLGEHGVTGVVVTEGGEVIEAPGLAAFC